MDIEAAGATHVGRVREKNEDAFVVDHDLGVFAVSDGMGGHAAGEVASRTAIDAVVTAARSATKVIEAVASEDEDHTELVALAERCVRGACNAVHGRATSDPALSGMGCTLTVLLVGGRRAAMAHAGDSRLYLFRDGASEQLSTDHTMAEEMRRSGQLTTRQASASRYSSVLTRCIGAQESVPVETLMMDVLPDDVFLLCSDGLSDHFEGLGEVAGYLADDDLGAIPDQLVAMANERGGHDNVTAIALRALASPGERGALAEEAALVQQQVRALQAATPFQGIRFGNLLRLSNMARVATYASGEAVVKKGDGCHGVRLILEGRFSTATRDGAQVELGPGECFGLTTLMEPRPAAADLESLANGAVLEIPGASLLQLARRRPWFGMALFENVARAVSRGAVG